MRARRLIAIAGMLLVVGLVAVLALRFAHQRGTFEPATDGGPVTMRLITADQYLDTVHHVFGEDIEVSVSLPLPPRREGLVSLGTASVTMTPSALEQFDRAARFVAMQVVDEEHRRTLVPCAPRTVNAPDPGCAARFIARVGHFLYRRPLTEAERDAHVTVANDGADTLESFYDGLAYALAGMLTSPRFLYITEATEPDPERPGTYRLDAWSKASRLSLFLWNGLPDDALLVAAERGDLHDDGKLSTQIDRMLASPRLSGGVRAFFGDLLRVADFETISKDPILYPAFTSMVSQDVHEQLLRVVVDHLLVRQGDYRDLFTSERTFVSRTLGPFYQAPVTNGRWEPYELQGSAAGPLTSLSFLAAHSHPGRSSPTRRGMAIREIFLCQTVPDPPPNVDFAKFEDLSGKMTARDRLDAHNVDPVCAGCHRLTDPIGLALENFDGAGQFRLRENEVVIDTSGEFDGRPFDGAASLGDALSKHPALVPCFVSRLYAYGVGRAVDRDDRPWLAWVAKRFAVHGYRLVPLLREMAESEGFFAVTAPGDAETVVARRPAGKEGG